MDNVVKKCIKRITFTSMFYSERTVCSRNAAPGEDFCRHHLNSQAKRVMTWGVRKDYEPVTDTWMRAGFSMKLKTENANNLYKWKDGIIYKWSNATNRYSETTILAADINLFCRKK